MRIADVFDTLERLFAHCGTTEAQAIARALLEDGLGLSHARSSSVFPSELESRLAEMSEQVLQGRPVAYVCGKTWFYGLSIVCDERALIPRPETEELVHHILEDFPERRFPKLRVLDIGTGTGCISLALKHQRPDWSVWALDVSGKALDLAAKNAGDLGLEVRFLQADILRTESVEISGTFDLIVANPPYIPPSEADFMDAAVKQYEPALALYTPQEDPLCFYRAIRLFAERQLKKGGYLYLELNAFRAGEVAALFSSALWQAEIRQDMQGKKRYAVVCFRQ